MANCLMESSSYFEPLTLYGNDGSYFFDILLTIPGNPRNLFDIIETRLYYTVDEHSMTECSIRLKKRVASEITYSFNSLEGLCVGVFRSLKIKLPSMSLDEMKELRLKHSSGEIQLFHC